MAYRTRIKYTSAQKAEMWARWQRGESLHYYDCVCKLALDLHKQIFHFDLVSWDFAIGSEGEPIFLEVNFQGVVHVYQFACRKPLFGDLTKDVLEAVRDSR